MSRFEIIYNDDTKVIIIKDHCEESDILKQWVDDYNNGKNPKYMLMIEVIILVVEMLSMRNLSKVN